MLKKYEEMIVNCLAGKINQEESDRNKKMINFVLTQVVQEVKNSIINNFPAGMYFTQGDVKEQISKLNVE